LAEPYLWRFQTGSAVLSGVQTVAWEDPGTGVAEGIYGETQVLRVLHPADDNSALVDGATLVPTGGASLNIEFNAVPSGDLMWLSGFITLESKDVLGWDLRGRHIGVSHNLEATPTDYLYTSESASVNSKVVTVSRNTGAAGFVDNTEYTLTVKAGVQASGWNEMQEDYQVNWTTTFYPIYSTSTIVRLLSGPFIENIPDDTIRRMILHHSRRVTTQNNNTIYTTVPKYVIDYVSNQTAVDVIRQELSARAGYAGRKQLGDLSIDIDVEDIKGLLDDTIEALEDNADEAWGLIETRGKRIKPTTIVRGRYASGPHPGINWNRILDWGGCIRWTTHGPTAPEWLTDTTSRDGIYEKILGNNPMPSRIHAGEYIYALTNFNI
jgi:hypothetical protein